MSASLAQLLVRMERGERIPTDPWLSILPAPAPGTGAVVALPGHVVVATDLPPDWVRDQLPGEDLSAPLNPPFLSACERKLGRRVNAIDGLYLAAPVAGPPDLPLVEVADLDHPRVRRARRYRPDLRVWSVDGGVVVVGRGLAGRWEVAIEVAPESRGSGLGRALARAARNLIPEPDRTRPLWAQVSPGNAASVRAFLAAGYRPVGAEALFVP